MSLGLDLFFKEVLTNPTQSYASESYGAGVKVSAPLMDGVTSEAHYSLVNQSVSLTPTLMACIRQMPRPRAIGRRQAGRAQRPQWVSTVGSTPLIHRSTIPRARMRACAPSFARTWQASPVPSIFCGPPRRALLPRPRQRRCRLDAGSRRIHHALWRPDIAADEQLLWRPAIGPRICRQRFGPRDVTPGTTQDNIGGSRYWTTSAELQAPIPGMPPEIALKTAVFADAGSLWGYRGANSFPSLSQSLTVVDSQRVRSSIGSSLIWDSPFGPLRVDYAYPTSKASTDVTQRLHFGVGAF